MKSIIKIINEEINIFESEVSPHAYRRIKERLKIMSNNNDITSQEAAYIDNNVNNVINHNFNTNKTYGINLGRFKINPNSALVTHKHKSGSYYEINSVDGNDIVKDSTGNEFWGVVRNNTLVTISLRKSIQRHTAEESRNSGGLGVDMIIDDFNKYLRRINNEKELQKQKEQIKQQHKILKINGVSWQIDDINQIIFKKNNPNVFVDFDDILDYPDWDDDTKEEIINNISIT